MSRSRSRSWQKRRRSRSNSFHKRAPRTRSSSPLPDLPAPFTHYLKAHNSSTFSSNLTFSKDMPTPNPLLGNHQLMIDTKSKIDPYYDTWDSIKFMLNPYELIDIYRPAHIASKRYHTPVIDYHK